MYAEFNSFQNDPFLPFVSKLVNHNKNILNYLIYIICNSHYNYEHGALPHHTGLYSLKQFLLSFGKFIRSCGIYGECPYLYVDNGIGDIPQAFCRIASIFGTTYILHPKIEISKISRQGDSFHIETNLCSGDSIKTPVIYFGPTNYHLRTASITHIS